jgi:hypothetical protein
MGQKSSDRDSILVLFANTPIEGFAAGTGLVATPNAKRWTKKAGGQNEVTRSKSNNRCYTFKFTLARSSLSNTFLSSLVNTDDLTPGGVTHPLLIKDLISGSTYTSKNAWVSGFPDDEMMADEAADLEWEIDAGETLVQINGTPSQASGE